MGGATRKKKGSSGEATWYISRNQAIKKLQVNVNNFRRLCILKGIYPRLPAHRQKAQGGDSTVKTLFYKKDILFLMHDPIISSFREHKVHKRMLKSAMGKKDIGKYRGLQKERPKYNLAHIIQERYPTFIDALRDMDDPLTLCALFAKMPRDRYLRRATLRWCQRLTVEFMHYVIETQSLRKVFISIKGYYYQVEIMGQTITWLAPHPFNPKNRGNVDLKVMKDFLQVYINLLGFVNYRLFRSINYKYPPTLPEKKTFQMRGDKHNHQDRLATLNVPLKTYGGVQSAAEGDEEMDYHLLNADPGHLESAKEELENVKRQQNLFKGLKFFIARENNLESLTFVIRACRGKVSWDSKTAICSTYQENDESITHHICDKKNQERTYLSRYYIQPQWVYDCINARILLPVQDYFPGVSLPPHLSPFTFDTDLYEPPEKHRIVALQKGVITEDELMEKEEESEEEVEKKKETKKQKGKRNEKENTEAVKKKKSRGVKKDARTKNEDLAKQPPSENAVKEKPTEAKTVAKEDTAKEPRSEDNENSMDIDNENVVADIASKEENIDAQSEEAAKDEIHEKAIKRMKVRRSNPFVIKKSVIRKQEKEEFKFREMMIPRKKKKIYRTLKKKEQQLDDRVINLTRKRKLIDEVRQSKGKKNIKVVARELEQKKKMKKKMMKKKKKMKDEARAAAVLASYKADEADE